MHHGILSTGIENGGHWLWPSRSFWPFWLRILGNLACPLGNSSQIWAGITKFAPNMHHGILSAGIENGGHWLWASRSFWPLWLRILRNLACLRDNSSQIWARITKFAPNMHPGILLVGIENGGHWPWPSRSFWPFWLRILGISACLPNNFYWIWARITKCAPNMHLGILAARIENGRHWPWPSRPFGHFNSQNGIQRSSCTLI